MVRIPYSIIPPFVAGLLMVTATYCRSAPSLNEVWVNSIVCPAGLAFVCDSCRIEDHISAEAQVDKILIAKNNRRLTLISNGKVFKTYPISLGFNPKGPKVCKGDGRTPEGVYIIDGRNPNSRYHLALHISYPNAADRVRARRLGVKPGGNIMIHGSGTGFSWLGSLHRFIDWTEGCIAVTNAEIEEIWRVVPDGTIVEINP